MKKFYSIIATAFVLVSAPTLTNATVSNVAPLADDVSGDGVISWQVDMNAGYGEPELTEPEISHVSASFEAGVLTINMPDNLEPLSLEVDMESGDAAAIDQVAYIESFDGETFTYYYGDIATEDTVLYATVANTGTNSCLVTIQPWGECMEFLGGYYFNVVYYNTEIVLDFAIPGLGAAVELPELTIDEVSYESIASEYGAYVEFTVVVAAENLNADDVVTLYFKGPHNDSFVPAEETEDLTYKFTIGGVEVGKVYNVTMYAQTGNITSEEVTQPFTLDIESGINTMGCENGCGRYFNFQGVEVKNPAQGNVYIRVIDNKAQKVIL